MINESFTDDKYLNALLESNRSDIERFQKWFLKENVSEEEIIQEAELLMEAVDIKKAGKFVTDKMKHIEKTLKENGVSVSHLKASGKSIAKKMKGYHDRGLKPEEASKEILKDMVKVTKQEFMKVKKHLDISTAIGEGVVQVLISILFYILIIQVSSIIITVLAMSGVLTVIGPIATQILLTVVLAPMIEEAAKNYFISMNMPWIGTGVVFGIEAISYIISMMTMGVSLPAALLVRVMALMMHFSTTAIQKYIISKAETPQEETSYRWMAWIAGVLIHASWNAAAIAYNGEISRLITGGKG